MSSSVAIQRVYRSSIRTISQRSLQFWLALVITIAAFLARLPYLSHGLDQWDVVLYAHSLVAMRFYREAQWPLLLLFQKGLWLLLPRLSAPQILSLTNIILGAATLGLFFYMVRSITRSYLAGLILTALLYYTPVFAVYSVVGMQDMAQTFAVTVFVAVVLRFCSTRRPNWLYGASLVAGLAMGVRPTLVLLLPALLVAMILTLGLDWPVYWRAGAAFVAGALVWIVADRFIPPLPNARPVAFFLHQYDIYNPKVLGPLGKAGDYILLTGYHFSVFYWMPLVWLVVYVVAKRTKPFRLAPILALIMAAISLAVAFGLKHILSSPHPTGFWLLLIILAALVLMESRRLFLAHTNLFERSNHEAVGGLVLFSLILTYVGFNYIFTGPVPRYLLPTLPALLLLIMILTKGHRRSQNRLVALLLLAFGYWAAAFGLTRSYLTTFKTLDTRSSVVDYVEAHSDGRYYYSDDSLAAYFQEAGLSRPIEGHPKSNCSNLDPARPNYIISYGPASSSLIKGCSSYGFQTAAVFQRNEHIIEDSVGNVGYTIYRLVPRG